MEAVVTSSAATTTIDNEIGRLGKPIELMKIDVQGAELEVLLGAQASLYDNRNLVVIYHRRHL